MSKGKKIREANTKDVKTNTAKIKSKKTSMDLTPANSLGDSHLAGSNLTYLEGIYGEYLSRAPARDAKGQERGNGTHWDSFFTALPDSRSINGDGNSEAKTNGGTYPGAEFSYGQFIKDLNSIGIRTNGVLSSSLSSDVSASQKQHSYNALVQAYRVYGHKKAATNPLNFKKRFNDDELKLESYGFSSSHLDTEFSAEILYCKKDRLSLRDTIARLEQTYCGSLSCEFMYISDKVKKNWLLEQLESNPIQESISDSQRMRIMERLVAAAGLEASLASKYPGTKRFGLEGGEVLIPMIDDLAQEAGKQKVKEIVIAMAHRGRLNMLVNIFGKKPATLFDEFEGKYNVTNDKLAGDVKYHQGFSCNLDTAGGEVHMALAFNPSHLEIVSPVAEGSVRARQDRRDDKIGEQVMPVIIHGDASFSGQGVVMETLQMSNLKGFRTGGSIHIILNNQIGFTVSDVGDARSTEYASDVAKMLEAPIIHVNGDDPESVIFATNLALQYRMKYHSDVVIDVICYRRHGHNEADEPSMTQPMMYAEIKKHKPVNDLYAAQLLEKGLLEEGEYEELKEKYRDHLDKGDHVSLSLTTKPNKKLFVDWDPYLGHTWEDEFDTSIKLSELKKIGGELKRLPQDFVLNKRVEKVFAEREAMLQGKKPVDWGYAELLAYGSLINVGHRVRISGQDSRRGTFSHRHAVVHNQNKGESYCPLQHMKTAKEKYQIFDSFLSEEAAMAFEYGYATTNPNCLVIWEAQFGDFANGAQVVIDQFLSSGETKWQRLCGLALFLPHGYEGQGPEHSSARLERYLQLCADQNMQVCVPSTAGQVFHMLRRQIIRLLRKPLVVMMPKSLLRKDTSSTMIADMAKSEFLTVIDEVDSTIKAKDVKRVILCSGKVYYELLEHRKENKIKGTAIIRLEQLYPFPHQRIAQILGVYKNTKHFVWCQEEPMNQGAWYSTKHHLDIVQRTLFPQASLLFAGRAHAASPAAGYMTLHNRLQMRLIKDAFENKE